MCLFLAGQALGVRARTSIYLSRVAEWSRMQRGGGQPRRAFQQVHPNDMSESLAFPRFIGIPPTS